MSFITQLALRRRPVTILVMLLLFALGVYSYINLQRELFPEISFPNIAVNAFYANSDPETLMRDVTEPIEDAISGIDGLRETRSNSTESRLNLLATFNFGSDMKEAEREIESAINGANLPDDVVVFVTRLSTDVFPVIQFTVSGDEDIPSLQRLVADVINPRLSRIEGVGTIWTLGEVEEQVIVSVDSDKLKDLRLSSVQVADAITQNNISLPAGSINTRGAGYPVRTASKFGSIENIRELTVGFEQTDTGFPAVERALLSLLQASAGLEQTEAGFPQVPQGPQTGKRAIKVSDVAEVELTTADPQRISRANGKPGFTLAILKDPEANTAQVTEAVSAAMDEMMAEGVIPPNVEVLELANDGPRVRESLESLLREGTLGFLFAIAVVFIFLLNIRPSLLRGIALSLRPTAIIAISIPLSVLTGILLMSTFTDISLNFMSLAGLAIAVGRVVDDSIVVLENIYRHINLGESRFEAAINGTREVGAAIISSTLTTVVIFIPLAFIQGVVGEFFSPFAISVSLALLASTAVAITIVPVLCASLLKRGDVSGDVTDAGGQVDRDMLIQRIYTPMLRWSLRYKFITVAIAIIVTVSSLGLIAVIPITFFPASTPEYLTINIELPVGTSVERTYMEALAVEEAIKPYVERGWVTLYQTTIGGRAEEFDSGAAGGFHLAGAFVRLSEDVPDDIEDIVRRSLPDRGEDVSITVSGIVAGPAQGDLEVNITGPNFNEISDVSRRLEERLANVEGIVNVGSTVSEGKDEVVIKVNPSRAGEYSLTTTAVGLQVNQFIVGRTLTDVDIAGKTVDIVIRGDRDDVDDIEKLKNLQIESPVGPVKLGVIADIGIEKSPLSIFRFDSERSALITGDIIAENTRAVGVLVQQEIDSLENVPPGVKIVSGGIFEQINEGFQDVFVAMAVGVVLVYLVMVASLGALRTPFIIVLSLPLAVVGALLALLITGRTLSLSALMGFLLLVGIVVTNAIVFLTFVEQLRERGYDVYDAIIEGGRVRLRPILMTAFTTTFALFPLALSQTDSGIIGAELATVVIGGLVSSTFLTLIVVPAVYWIFNVSIPSGYARISNMFRRTPSAGAAAAD